MCTFFMKRHTWLCPSERLERALDRMAKERSDSGFQALVACLVLDAVRGVTLYSPAYPAGDSPLQFRIRNVPALALYTDEMAAGQCGHLCNTTDDHMYFLTMERAVPVPLANALGALRNAGGALALNLGEKNTAVLPPQVVDTVHRLYEARSYGWKFADDSGWNEWVRLVEKYERSPEAALAAPVTLETEEAEVKIPLSHIRREGKQHIFYLE